MAELRRVFLIEGTSREKIPHPPARDPFPANWRVFNAARPIPGTETWTGDFLHGIFYAAIDPQDPDADMWEKRCIELDGHLLVPIPRDEVMRWARAFYAEQYPNHPIDWDNVDYRDVATSWLNYHKNLGDGHA